MHSAKNLAAALFLLFSMVSCTLQCKEELLLEPDLSPPVLISILPSESPEVSLCFNEAVFLEERESILEGGIPVTLHISDENTVVIHPEEELTAGALYKIALTVNDTSGNSCRFVLPFWGWNPDIPDVLINELNPQGSDSNPDCIELYFLEDGNTAGMCLYYGSSRFYDYRYILPSVDVLAGDYMIIHCRREFKAEERNEALSKSESGGKLSSDEAWDLWTPDDQGLSGSNGSLSLYNAPDGTLLDAVIYSDREPYPEDDYLGWTSRTFDAVVDLYRQGGWDFSSESLSPREAVSTHETTATRSLCRNSQSEDSNSSTDWHTVPTSSKSFGTVNTDEVYSP